MPDDLFIFLVSLILPHLHKIICHNLKITSKHSNLLFGQIGNFKNVSPVVTDIPFQSLRDMNSLL